MSVYNELVKSNDMRDKLKHSDINKNIIYAEDEFGNKKIIRPGNVGVSESRLDDTGLRLELRTSDLEPNEENLGRIYLLVEEV